MTFQKVTVIFMSICCRKKGNSFVILFGMVRYWFVLFSNMTLEYSTDEKKEEDANPVIVFILLQMD